jgi:glutathione S-transferase
MLEDSMQTHLYVALVTLLTAMVYFWMATEVARTRTKVGILPPAMVGDPKLERTIRAHSNTLEWLPIFLPALWLFAVYWNSTVAAALGLLWVIGRVVYFLGYVRAPLKRYPGFFIQALATAALVLGAFGRLVYLAVTGSAG